MNKHVRVRQGLAAVAMASIGALTLGMSQSVADDAALLPCIEAVGTFLTKNAGEDGSSDTFASRSLISLTNGGHAFFTDSEEPGGDGFSPFSEARGAWQCDSGTEGAERIKATVVDFVYPGAAGADRMLGRLDIAAIFDSRTAKLSGTMTLFMTAFDADPLADTHKPVATGNFDGFKITAQ